MYTPTNPINPEEQINALWPDNHSEEVMAEFEKNLEDFTHNYKKQIDSFWDSSLTGYIAGSYEKTGDIQQAVAYWVSRIEGDSWLVDKILQCIEEKTPEELELSQDFLEHPLYPILKHYNQDPQSQNYISLEQLKKIEHIYSQWNNALIAQIKNILPHHPALISIEEYMSENTTKREQNCLKDFPEIWQQKNNIINTLVSQNYIQILWENWVVDKESSWKTSLGIAANKIIYGKKSFSKNETFTQAYAMIKNPDEHTKLDLAQALLSIYLEVNTDTGAKGSQVGKRNEQRKIIAEMYEKHKETLFFQAQDWIQKARENQENTFLQLQEKLASVRMLEEKNSGDGGIETLAAGGEIDILADTSPDNPETLAA